MVKRKIPARKHHGIRDPLKQQAERYEKIKNKINNPPTKKQEQEKIPYSLSQIIKGKDLAKRGIFKRKTNVGIEDKPKTTKNKIKRIKRLPNEDDENYLKRVNRATTDSLKEAEYEIKYGVEVHRNVKTGEISIKKKPKNEIDELIKNKKNEKRGKNKTKSTETKLDPKLAKEVIKQVLKEEKEQKKKNIIEEYKVDHIKFGEIVHAPPTFSVIPKKAVKNETVSRPGKKDLLLKNIIEENSSKVSLKKVKSRTDFKGKRKDLSTGARDMIEKERAKFVELYRNLKKNNTSD